MRNTLDRRYSAYVFVSHPLLVQWYMCFV